MRRILKSKPNTYNGMMFEVLKDNGSYVFHLTNSTIKSKRKNNKYKFIISINKFIGILTELDKEDNIVKKFSLTAIETETIEKKKKKSNNENKEECKEEVKAFIKKIKKHNVQRVIESIANNAMQPNFTELFCPEVYGIYGVVIDGYDFNEEEIILKVSFKDDKKENKDNNEEKKELSVCNGLYNKEEYKIYKGIQSVWYYFDEYEDKKATSFALDFETDYQETDETLGEKSEENENLEYQAISFSLCDINRTFAMTTTNIIGDNDRLVSYIFELIDEVTPNRKQRVEIYCHNLTFDGSYIVTYLLKNGFKCIPKYNQKEYNTFAVIHSQGLIKIDLNYNGVHYIFKDTARLLALPLSKISNDFRKNNPLVLQKDIIDYQYNITRSKGYIYSNEEIVYCINDVIVTSLIPEYMQSLIFGELKLTIAGTCYNEFKLSFRYGILDTKTLVYLITLLYQIGVLRNKGFNDLEFEPVINENNWTKFFIHNKEDKYLLRDFYSENIDLNIKSYEDFQEVFGSEIEKIYNMEELEEYVHKRIDQYPFTKYLRIYENMNDYSILYYLAYTNTDQTIYKRGFTYYFPTLSEEEDYLIRRAYKGGLTVANLNYIGIDVKNRIGCSADIKSSFPNVLSNYKTPYGHIKYASSFMELMELKTKILNNTDLYTSDYFVIFKIYGTVTIKKNRLPILFNSSVFSTSFNHIYNEVIDGYYLSLQEYLLMLENYDASVDISEIMIFNTCENMFKAYYDRYFTLKEKFKKTAFYNCIKVMCNSLYGKFGQNTYLMAYQTTMVDYVDNGLRYTIEEETNEDKKAELTKNLDYKYLPVAVFTTAIGRCNLIKGANSVVELGGEVIYTDTDSLYIIPNSDYMYNFKDKVIVNGEVQDIEQLPTNHLYINGQATNILIGKELGNFEIEHHFDRFKTLCPKKYILHDFSDDTLVRRCAGIAGKYVKNFTFDDYNYNIPHKTNKSRTSTYGKEIYTDIVISGYKQYIYMTADGKSFQSSKRYKVGDKIMTEYHEEKEIIDLIYERNE